MGNKSSVPQVKNDDKRKTSKIFRSLRKKKREKDQRFNDVTNKENKGTADNKAADQMNRATKSADVAEVPKTGKQITFYPNKVSKPGSRYKVKDDNSVQEPRTIKLYDEKAGTSDGSVREYVIVDPETDGEDEILPLPDSVIDPSAVVSDASISFKQIKEHVGDNQIQLPKGYLFSSMDILRPACTHGPDISFIVNTKQRPPNRQALLASNNRKNRLFVAAIDFGTTYSGYAFSSKDGFKKEPLKIVSNVWNAGTRSLISHKAPTALLLKPDETFHAFGYEAENKYIELSEEEDDYKDYYYFHRFKMILHKNQKLRRETLVKDESGKTLPAKEVFAHAMRYLRNHLLSMLKDNITDITENDIQYVLTVPAIWDDNAKHFMREAAKQAGIERDQLIIALEPEVASIFCQNLPVVNSSDKKEGFTAGTKYMVVDLGGGTTDITLHQKQADGSLKEFAPATGGSFGGTNVDAAFTSFLEEIIGSDNLKQLKQESLEDFVDLLREFETKKREITVNKPGKVTMTLPFSLVSILKKDKSKNGFDNAVKNSRYAQTVNFKNQKLQIANETFRSLFEPTIEGIVNIIDELLSDSKLKDLENILMVGGFSDCELVQNAIREKFGHKRIIIPDEADLVVLKGAVLFGHVPATISSRAARRTYGIQSWPLFDPRTHQIQKKVVIDGVARCKDSFFKYVEIGQDVTPGFQKSQIFQILKPDEESLELTVYWSSNRDPVYIDEAGCHVLGVLRIPVDPDQAGPMEVEETMIFGETEVQIQATNISTGTVYTENFDFLDEHND